MLMCVAISKVRRKLTSLIHNDKLNILEKQVFISETESFYPLNLWNKPV